MAAVPLDFAKPFHHVSVMPGDVVEELAPSAGEVFVDATAGGGGHSAMLLEACPTCRVLSFDRDLDAVNAARSRLEQFGDRAVVAQGTFDALPSLLRAHGLEQVDGLLADLGVSSPQLDDPDRGMSFRMDGPLDMRMDSTSGETALELLARVSQEELADIIYRYGEERASRRIASRIKQALAAGEIDGTQSLRRAVVRAVGPQRRGGIDPATRTFQALRIAVNGELEQLEALLALAPALVPPGGRLSVISFHSLEDRMVKRAVRERALWRPLRSKPRVASDTERAENPRSRSAKLRTAVRLAPEGEG